MNKPAQRQIATTAFAVLLLSFAILAGCSTKQPKSKNAFRDRPETVLVTYHVRMGKEEDFKDLLERAWKIYRSENLVKSEPHLVVRFGEENQTVGYIEVFTWVNHAAPLKVPDSIKKIWAEEHGMCEARSGRTDIGGGEVELLAPRN
jgi:hypothetical protein